MPSQHKTDYYLTNKDKIKTYNKAYYQKQKELKRIEKERNESINKLKITDEDFFKNWW